MLTSILEEGMKQRVAQEMLRGLVPGGIDLWFYYHRNNPCNPDMREVSRKEVHRIFPCCGIGLQRTDLAPPLARRIVPLSWVGALLLEKFPFLCTHYLGRIRKPEGEVMP